MRREVDSLRKQVEKLEGDDVQKSPENWESVLVAGTDSLLNMGGSLFPGHEFSDPIPGDLRSRGKGVVIDVNQYYCEWIPDSIWKEWEDSGKTTNSACVVIRLRLGSETLNGVDRFWRYWEEIREIGLRQMLNGVESPPDLPDNMMRESHMSGFDIDGVGYKFNEATEIDIGKRGSSAHPIREDVWGMKSDDCVSILCRLSYKKGGYMRIHLSKGWSRYFLDGGIETSIPVNFDIFGFDTDSDKTLDGMVIPMRCNYIISEKDGFRVKLPSWFKELDGGSFNVKRSFMGKVKRVFITKEDDEPSDDEVVSDGPKSRLLRQGVSAHWNKVTGRNELRLVNGNFGEYHLPERGMLDMELHL